jgi:hypothetical protein
MIIPFFCSLDFNGLCAINAQLTADVPNPGAAKSDIGQKTHATNHA